MALVEIFRQANNINENVGESKSYKLSVFEKMLEHLKSNKAYYPLLKQKDKINDIGRKIKEFLSGGQWFEVYVSAVLNERLKDRSNFRLISNYQAKKKATREKGFDIDTLILNGYQACAIECAITPDIAKCKLKGFQVLQRAYQIGGDEAKAILVLCCLKNSEAAELRKDILRDCGTSIPFEVIGVNDLEPDRLWKRVKNHLGI